MIECLAAWPGAELLRNSGTAYLLVNACHILGIGLLVGAILPLDLRLTGLLGGPPGLVPWLTRVAGTGLSLALLTGLWLVSVDPADYLANPAFRVKLGLLAAALVNIAATHLAPEWRAARDGTGIAPTVRIMAGLSAALWLATLLAGRWIGFV